MADDTSDEARDPISRLQGADPAQGAPEPDLAAIRARASDQSGVVPMRRRRTAITVGAVAAGVVLLAGTALAGVAVGRVTAPAGEIAAAPVAEESMPVVGAASPPIPVVAGQPAGAPAAMGAPETMSAGTEPAVADKAMIYPGYGASMLPGPDLTDEPGTAPGYRLDAEGIDLETLTRQLGAAFAIPGEPQKQEYGWMIGSPDGTGPSIWVGEDATVSWSFSDPSINPWECGAVAEPEPAPADGATSASSDVNPTAPESCKPAVAPISERDAVRQARKILSTLGVTDQAVDGIDVEWESGSDDYTTWVTAWQRVDGQRTQLSWSFTFAGETVAWASGFAAGLEQVPSYPIVGARTAVTRTSDPRFAAFGPTPLDFGGVVPMAGASSDGAVSSDQAPSVPQGDPRRVQVWWDPMLATGAELSLAQYWQPDGTLLILPAYRVTTADDRGTWAVIAVAQTAVEFVAPTE
ncbi:MAG: hypothetical protein RL134_806 [Actinomycetota bacterium]|jgi:hypothetical protein